MSRNPYRHERSSLMMNFLRESGWNSDPYTAGVVPDWNARYPKIPIVADGRPCKVHRETGVTTPSDARAKRCPECYTDRGRGTTLIDLTRKIGDRADFLQVKAATIGPDGKLPSRIELGSGLDSTISGIVDAAMRGSAIPIVLFASENDGDGSPSDQGFAVFFDAAPFIREYGCVPTTLEPFKNGQAPPVYCKLTSRKISGVPGGTKAAREAVQAYEQYGLPLPRGKWERRAEGFEKGFDAKGRYWSSPYGVHYTEVRISLSACGIKRANWVPMNLGDLPQFIEKNDWRSLSWGDDLIG